MKKILFFNYTIVLLILFICCSNADSDEEQKYVFGNKLITCEEGQIAFVHLSDIHSSCSSLSPSVCYMESCDCHFGLLTGDIMATPAIIEKINLSTKPFLLIPGNHDAYKVYHGSMGQFGFRSNLLNKIKQDRYVSFGTDYQNFWYRDCYKDGYTLRVIGIDQYEAESVGHPIDSWEMQNLYSQQQIDWFISLLEESDSIDGIIIAIHNGFGNKHINCRDTSGTINCFTSILARHYNNGYDYYGTGNLLLIPDIINAYQTGINIKGKKYLNSTIIKDSLTVTTNFNKPHNNFIAYFGGHLHFDIVETLACYPHQLLVLMNDGSDLEPNDYNDIPKGKIGNENYCFNVNTIDFRKRQLIINRIGANRKIDGSKRDSIILKY